MIDRAIEMKSSALAWMDAYKSQYDILGRGSKRVLTSLLLTFFAILFLIYGSVFSCKLLLFILVSVCGYELSALVLSSISRIPQKQYFSTIFAGSFSLLMVLLFLTDDYQMIFIKQLPLWYALHLFGIGGTFLHVSLLQQGYYAHKKEDLWVLKLTFFALGLLQLFLSSFCFLTFFERDRFLLFAILFLTSIADVFGFLVGKFYPYGRPFPLLSQKKTTSGTLAMVLAPSMFCVMPWFYGGGYDMFMWRLVVVGAIGLIGDLWMSRVKRIAQVKNSGDILPGHGGFLDRFDSHFM